MARVDIVSEIAGKVWQIKVKSGDPVEQDDPVIILESMKMEIPVAAPAAGSIVEILVSEEELVSENQTLAVMETG
ncbi:MAG: acetyl-CoA carboxylase biotin carboxyl carrier protein subunit [Parvularculales bacterium]